MKSDTINSQKYIYFYSPMGTWIRVNKNLEYLGLNNNKRICNTLTNNFTMSVKNNTYHNKYKDYDVIYLDEFYDNNIDFDLCYKVLQKFVNNGKQIVMAGHGTLESLVKMPKEMKKQVVSYNLMYDLDWNDDYSNSIKYIE